MAAAAAALAFAIGGWVVLVRAGARIPVGEARLGGLTLRLEKARWLEDQMDHGVRFGMPSSMTPDLPDGERQRLTVEVALHNPGAHPRVFRGDELRLISEAGREYPPLGQQPAELALGSGQRLYAAVQFDFDAGRDPGSLALRWQRRGEHAYLFVPAPPEHDHARPRGVMEWPPDVALLLPIGRAERGRALFGRTYGCAACHGDVGVSATNRVGPHLAGIGRTGASRVPGRSAAQYIYESIVAPSAHIATGCRGGPCAEPSAMPEYAGVLTFQEMADLVAYLIEQTEDERHVGES